MFTSYYDTNNESRQLTRLPVFVPKLVGNFQDPIYGGKSAQFSIFYHHFWQPLQNQPEMGQFHLTQEALAAAVGVSRQTIIAIEKSKFVPSVKLALELTAALDVSLEEYFWLEKNSRK